MSTTDNHTSGDSPLLCESVVQPSKTVLSIRVGVVESTPSTSSGISTVSSVGATTPELLQDDRPSFEIAITTFHPGVAARSRVCAAWAILLASYSHEPDISMCFCWLGQSGDDVGVHVQWEQTVHDLVDQVESRLTETLKEKSPAPILEFMAEDGPEGNSNFTETLHIAIPSSQTQPRKMFFTCQTRMGCIYIKPHYSDDVPNMAYEHIKTQYEYIFRQMCLPEGDSKLLVDMKVISLEDLDQVWKWNESAPQAAESLGIHQSFMERATRHPELSAIAAHDGQLTYRELDDLSTRLAVALIQRDIKPRGTIIIFIEKSMWVPVAQLAVMKCGCASVVFDVSLPRQRHETLVRAIDAACILMSPDCEDQVDALRVGCIRLTLSQIHSKLWPSSSSVILPEVKDTDTLYICFTSGSTGTPKGAIISHRNYASAAALQKQGLDLRDHDRVFDFASYAFDAAWCNMLHAFMIGGCLCIPSDEERKGDLVGALNKYQPNYAVLTPSVAWFPAAELPESLRTIHFGGEPLKASMVKELSSRVTVINAYGPAECSTVSTAVVTDPQDADDPTIGTGLGACTWVVRSDRDGSDLVAVGDIGELWIEGPIVGQGYLNEPEKSAAAFVESPSWLLRGCPGFATSRGNSGRRGRLYRTGDLVRYGADGALDFVGRKDSQVKIRGQRVELGEIEHHLERALQATTTDAKEIARDVQIVAEVLTPQGSITPTLVAFLFLASAKAAQIDTVTAGDRLRKALSGIEDRLAPLVPPYMIPSAFIPIEAVPMTATGKIDRRQLRDMGSKLYWSSSIAEAHLHETETATELQASIRKVWAEVLNLPIEKILLDSAFTRLGGDSISAMQVVSRCRLQGVPISVADILKDQTIRKISRSASSSRSLQKPKPQSLQHRKVDDDEPFPLTPIQQLFFTNNPEGMNHYTLSFIVKLAKRTTVDALSAALLTITNRHTMLRARFRRPRPPGDPNWEQYIAPAGPGSFHLEQHVFQDRETMQFLVDRRQASMDLVNGPVLAVDLFDHAVEAQTLLMSAHHMVMDLVSWRIIWDELGRVLSGTTDLPPLHLNFPTWSYLQQEEGQKLQSKEALPFEITPANFEYWQVSPNQLYIRNSVLNITHVDADTTSLLLGDSNDCLGTEIQDILLGTLIFCFSQVFPDRQPPTIFLEGHGREAVDGMDELGLSEVVGWFTSLHPVTIGSEPGIPVLKLIGHAKDIRKGMPKKGRSYFAARFYSESGREDFKAHENAEVIFNYRGSFQQLEDASSIVQLEDRPNRNLLIDGDGAGYRRPSLIDFNLVIQEGSLQVWTRSHKQMRNHDGIVQWANLFTETLGKLAQELVKLPPRCTLSDFPLLDISSSGLDILMTEQLHQMGISQSAVRDIYPCTPMQEGILISLSLERATYHTVSIWEAVIDGQPVSTSRLLGAWDSMSSRHAVLSTIFSINPDTGRFVQVVLRQGNKATFVKTPVSRNAVEYLTQAPPSKPLPSQPECFFTVCVDEQGNVACRLEMTHTLIDALSLPILVRDMEGAYMGQEMGPASHFRDYIAETRRTPHPERLSYWKKYLASVEECNFPNTVPQQQPSSRPLTQNEWVTLSANATDPISGICRENEITRSVFLHVAWSLVLAHFTNMRQVCFGYISSGRDLPVDGIDDMVGPLINMQIARVDLEKPLSSLLSDVRQYHIEHLDHQYCSLVEILHETSSKQLFNTNITVREARKNADVHDSGMHLIEVSEEDPHEYDLVLSGTLDGARTNVSIQYRTEFVNASNARAIGLVLEEAITYLISVLQPEPIATATSPTESPDSSLYNAYFSHTFHADEPSALKQWATLYHGINDACHFPAVSRGINFVQRAGASVSHTITDLKLLDGYDVPSQIFASWALLGASYGSTKDVIIGARIPNEKGVQPTPLRLSIGLKSTVSEYLSSVRTAIKGHCLLPLLPFNTLRAIDSDSALAWDFPAVLSVSERNNGHRLNHPGWEAPRKLSVHVRVVDSDVQITSEFDEGFISSAHIARILSQFETVLRQISLPTKTLSKLLDIDTISSQEFQQISRWNGTQYQDGQCLIHDLIARTTESMPDSLAISSWDGTLTYRQLDEFSTRLAYHLLRLGVGPEVIVPVYYEKSLWVAVSVVGIMKAGGAGVMIDCTQPMERIRSIFYQTGAKIALLSETVAATTTAAGLCSSAQLITVNEAFINNLPHQEPGGAWLPNQVQPSNLLYISFTSGSTGKPKGAMITHANFASSVEHQQTALGFKPHTRVYDFASYAFDAAWSNLLHSLTSGSCLCIPSEAERQNELHRSIRDSKASLLNMTPSVLRHLDPNDLPDLKQVLMGGESWAEADFLDWMDNKNLINSYGPGECTIKSCLIQAYRGMVPNTIGYAIGLNTWIVRTDGSDRLAPLGSVGELWLEGPQVGRGYIADEARTATSFISRPKWVSEFTGKSSCIQNSVPLCRFYRTGDLVSYGEDGTLVFQSRIDSQVKIRGQRTELGEVERSLQRALAAVDMKAQIVADVFTPLNSTNPILVAFMLADKEHAMQEKLLDVDHHLADMVPSYMIPTTYIALKDFPMTATGKINRKTLRDTYMALTLEEITAENALRASNHLPPTTETELIIQDLWARVLKIDAKTIFSNSNFFRMGGDSLGAMRLVALARKRGLAFTVADIFKQPQLRLFAANVSNYEGSALVPIPATIEPFSLLGSLKSLHGEVKTEAAGLCGIDPIHVEDVFPCTPLQGGLLAETAKSPGMYVLTESWALRDTIDRDCFRAAWQKVIQQNPILRTRIINLPHCGLVQVVVHYDCYKSARRMEATDIGLGTPLMSYDISESIFSWSIHHALYDGWTSPLLFNSLAKIYRGETSTVATPFQSFIKYLQDHSQTEADEFWRSQFAGFEAQNFPTLPTTAYRPKCDEHLTHEIELSAVDGFTIATKINLTWAILLATITNSADASFGTTVSGRQAAVPGIEDMMGPTIATVPFRITVDRSSTVRALLEAVQSQVASMVRFEQTGLHHIRRLSEDCKIGCDFQSFLIVQPKSEHAGENFFFESSTVQNKIGHGDPFNQYAICLTADLLPNHIGLHVAYDPAVVPPTRMFRLLHRFESIFKQVSYAANESRLISELDTSSVADMKQVWSWNDTSLERSDQKIHEIFIHNAAHQPNAEAVCSWDGDFTYAELDRLSTALAQELLRDDSFHSSQSIVPLYFEKSKWTPVSQLAVMKAGGTSTLLDAELPDRRLEVIIGMVQPQIMFTSIELETKALELAPPGTRVIVIGGPRTQEMLPDPSLSLPAVDPATTIYINFTSGSTGVPKGARVTHSNFASAIKHVSGGLRCHPNIRQFDYTAYAFDVTWQNVLFTLCVGGCLCIPSQYEIHNEPVEAVSRRRANAMHMVPSVSKLLHGAKLDLVNFGGEKPSLAEIEYWMQRAEVILTYGPAECTPTTTCHLIDPENPRVVIGKATGVRTWIVEPQFGKKLAAVGDIGELWLEGPVVGQGYLQNREKTEESFIDDPEWLLKGFLGFPGRPGRSYRTGDLVRYEEDGSIEYIGRKDAQIKIRGQRVYLEEIEHHIFDVFRSFRVSQVVADIIKPKGSSEASLIAFVLPSDLRKQEPGSPEALEFARQLMKTSRRGLTATVPSYMIPKGLMVVDVIPKTGSGKIDRNKLRAAAVAMRKEELFHFEGIGQRAPATENESQLHYLVAQVLSWDGEPFGMDNNFIQLGGDSISAMRLVSVARNEGMRLRVADILSKDTLYDVLETMDINDVVVTESEEPSFSLLDPLSLDSFVNGTVMPQIDSGLGTLVDVLPLTEMQRVYLDDNLHTPRRSWFFTYVDLDERVDLSRMIQSCEQLVELCDIYRTVFVKADDSILQCVFDFWKPVVHVIRDLDDIDNALDMLVKAEIKSPVRLEGPLIDFTLLVTPTSQARLVIGMSHAIYDGISRHHTLRLLASLYNGSMPRVPAFRSFVLYTRALKTDSYEFWHRILKGSRLTVVPSVAEASSQGGPPTLMQRSVPLPSQPPGITQASIFTLACAIALGSLTESLDVVIGRVVTGRAAVPGYLHDVVGPCLNRVPVRVRLDRNVTKVSLLSDLQKQVTEGIAHEMTGLPDIVNHCTDWPRDTKDFGCWIQYQNIDEVASLDILGATSSLQVKETWEVPVASDFLEILATPDKEGNLTIKIIAGPGYTRKTLSGLLDGVCLEIVDI